MPLTFDKTIKAGDLLTSVTVVIAAITLVATLDRERVAREREQATHVRQASASAISKLDRWQALQQTRFDDSHLLAVELSERFAAKPDAVTTRDALWRSVMEARSKVQRQIVDEQLGSAYTDLLAYLPTARSKYMSAFQQLAKLEESTTGAFLLAAEKAIRASPTDVRRLQTSELGNELRAASNSAGDQLRSQADDALRPLRTYLLNVISLTDAELLATARSRDG